MKIVMSIIAALFILLLPNRTDAQIIEIRQTIFGMDCAPCARGMEASLERMEGVRSVQISLNEGFARIDLDTENNISLDKIHTAVRHTGFSARDASLKAKGIIQLINSDLYIIINEEKYRIMNGGDLVDTQKEKQIEFTGVVEDREDDIWNLKIINIKI